MIGQNDCPVKQWIESVIQYSSEGELIQMPIRAGARDKGLNVRNPYCLKDIAMSFKRKEYCKLPLASNWHSSDSELALHWYTIAVDWYSIGCPLILMWHSIDSQFSLYWKTIGIQLALNCY